MPAKILPASEKEIRLVQSPAPVKPKPGKYGWSYITSLNLDSWDISIGSWFKHQIPGEHQEDHRQVEVGRLQE